MADPKWFDEDAYLANKLVQLQTIEPEKGWTPDLLQAELAKYSATPYQHFVAQGNSENISPNSYFNVAEYLKAKADQMNAMNDGQGYEGKTDWTEAAVQAEMAKYGVSAWDHYNQVGQYEGVNPSNALDTSAYFEDKAELLNAAKWEGRTDWTAADIQAIFKAAGCSPLTDPDQNLASIPAVPAEEQVSTNYNPYTPSTPGTPGETYELTTANDVITGTANDDIINGEAASLASARTLNPGDQIDGAGGKDTLNVAMNGNFTGFTGDGKLVNVETVNLTNEGASARTFTAKGVEGVETYNVTGAVNLAELNSADIAVNLAGRASGATSIAYAAKVTDGEDDALALGLSNMGTAAVKDSAGKVATAEAAVTVTAAGIETVNITATGVNVAKLGSNDAEALTVAGAGSLKLTGTGTGVKTVDASKLAGTLDLNLDDATGVTSVLAGAGDDIIHAGAGDLTVNAEIKGGEGQDTLSLNDVGTVQYQMAGVETVELNGGTTTFSAATTTDLENVVVKGATTTATFANMGAADLGISLVGATAGDLTSDHSGTTALTVTGGAKAAPTSNGATTTLTNSTAVTLTVDQYNTLAGDITAAAATSFTANVAGALDNTIALASATDAAFTTGKDASTVIMDAAKLTDLTVTAAGDFDLTTSTLSAVENLTVDTAGHFTGVALAKASVVDLSGAGNEAQVTLDDLGTTDLDYGISLTAKGLNGNLTVEDINTGKEQDVSVDVSGVTGDVSLTSITVASDGAANTGSINVNADGTLGDIDLGALTASAVSVNAANAMGTVDADINADTAEFIGSALMGNTVEMTATAEGTVVGGLAVDTITVKGGSAATATANFTITGGLGVDKFTINAATNGMTSVTITDFGTGNTGSQHEVLDGAVNATAFGTPVALTAPGSMSNDILAYLTGAGITGATAANITNVFSEEDDGTGANAIFTYAGSTYVAMGAGDGAFGGTDVLVKLAGVTTVTDATTAAAILA